MNPAYVIQPTVIYIVGPSSTGKTTLSRALVQRLGIKAPAYITEVARQVMKAKGFSRENVGALEMQMAIMAAQLEREKEARRSCSRIIISDRSAIDALVYAIVTASDEYDAKTRRETLMASLDFQAVLGWYKRAHFVLLAPVSGWLVDDGVRSMDNQLACLEVFRQTMDMLGIRYKEIGEEQRDLEERITSVRNLVNV